MSDKILSLQYSNFRGLWDKDDSGLIPASSELGVYASAIQNVNCKDGTITMGQGYEEENDGSSTTTHINGSDNTFIRNEFKLKRRDGIVINVAQLNNGKLEWKNTVLNRYETLLSGLTTDVDIAMIDFNKTNEDRTYFCDGVNNLSFWNKAIGYYASDDGSTIITLTVPNSAHTTLALAGFAASGSIILKDGTEITYSGLSGMTLTGCSAVPTSPTVGDGIAQKTDTSTLSTAPKGRILFKYQARLGVVVEASPTVINMSKVADGSDFSTTGVDGAFLLNIIDGDGRINDVKPFKKRLVVFKEGGIIPVLIEQLDSTTLRTQIEPLIEYSNIGPNNPGQVVSGLNQVYFISPSDKDIKDLSRVGEDKDIDLGATQLTTEVRNTLDSFDLNDSKIKVYKRDAFISAKSDVNSEFDTVIQLDAENKTFYFHKLPARNFWENEDNVLHFTDPSSVKSYRMFSGFDADGGSISYLWKSGRLNLGTNFYKKETNIFAVFGKMTTSSVLKCRLDFNNGALGTMEWDVNGDGSSKDGGKYILESDPASAYGQYPYGLKPYGGETDEVPTNYFLFFKTLPKGFSPYDIFASFAAEGDANYIKILSFGFNPIIKKELSKHRKI